MRNIPTELIKNFFRDRTMVVLVAALFFTVIIYSIYLALTLEPSDLQVATRYTAFGETHFYRNKWYYLLSFAFFGALLAGIHTALAMKLYDRSQRSLSAAFLGLTLIVFGIGWIVTHSVIKIAFL